MLWFMLIVNGRADDNIYSEVAKERKEKELIEKDENGIVQRLAVLKKLKNISYYERENLMEYYPDFYDELSSLFSESDKFYKDEKLINEIILDYESKLTQLKCFDYHKNWGWREVNLIKK